MARDPRARRPRPPSSAPPVQGEVEVHAIAAGGDGIARVNGLVVFLPRTAPGDRGRAEYAVRGRMARGTLIELDRPGPGRVEPPCSHYVHDRCGGCQLQHLSAAAQLEAKRSIVRSALQRIGGRGDVEVPPVSPSARAWRYRHKLTLALRRRGGRWIAGLHPFDEPGAVFPLADCPITDERVVAAWRELLAAAELLPAASELRGAVRLVGESAAFTLEGGARWTTSERFFAAVPSISTIWWRPERGARILLHDRGQQSAPGASFAQVNPEVAERLQALVVERALAYAPLTAIDGYAGAGDTAARLARAGVQVSAIELDPDAAAWSATRLPPGSRSLAGRVEDVLPGTLPAHVVVLNPPRGGLHERVTATLREASPPPRAILYVSCDPATLARDLARLSGYRVAALQCWDMFPQTAHVETFCELVPEAA